MVGRDDRDAKRARTSGRIRPGATPRSLPRAQHPRRVVQLSMVNNYPRFGIGRVLQAVSTVPNDAGALAPALKSPRSEIAKVLLRTRLRPIIFIRRHGSALSVHCHTGGLRIQRPPRQMPPLIAMYQFHLLEFGIIVTSRHIRVGVLPSKARAVHQSGPLRTYIQLEHSHSWGDAT
ncbi:hypothetical protein CC1G_15155 [Coprinopsis cinerea okayama7|uniref:Uncharacterized protein n=1 Tax=Coprinopsis cinerea (strain Okayama-7 / 130 / ATCC MYA-4618 / FGSC 9003) TaxID=240176 RepID=D6RPS2_COPC7|nr:hypothetical protein CC1G_15155 [Coprinopsis cinerea okayama7\|eukprot:XP_002910516.1 hypothetical protein CC1G_15155 [Coprinopsis cinerea okayama7\